MRHLLFILTTDNGTVGEGVGCDCRSRGRRQLVIIVMMMAEVMSIPTTVSWDSSLSGHHQTLSASSAARCCNNSQYDNINLIKCDASN